MHPHARTTGARAAEAFKAVVAEIEGSPFEQMKLDPTNFPKLVLTNEIHPGDDDYPISLTPILDATYTTMEWELAKEINALDWVKDRLHKPGSGLSGGQQQRWTSTASLASRTLRTAGSN